MKLVTCIMIVLLVLLSACCPAPQPREHILPTPSRTALPEPAMIPTTPLPTTTPAPTSTTVPDPNLVLPGTYLVGKDIQPGLYSGQAGADILESCYWARLNSLSGELGAIIANDNAMGPYYVEVAASDFALETHCELQRE